MRKYQDIQKEKNKESDLSIPKSLYSCKDVKSDEYLNLLGYSYFNKNLKNQPSNELNKRITKRYYYLDGMKFKDRNSNNILIMGNKIFFLKSKFPKDIPQPPDSYEKLEKNIRAFEKVLKKVLKLNHKLS